MSMNAEEPGAAQVMSMNAEEPGAAQADASALNREILDALTDLVKQFGAIGQSIAAGFGVTPSDLLALVKLDGVLSMKELAQRMGCDASFITSIADELERHGLARRAPSQRDRRVKNLVLTEDGIAAKERLMRELAAQMPWCYALDEAERRCLLSLLKKMLAAARARSGTTRETGAAAGDTAFRSE